MVMSRSVLHGHPSLKKSVFPELFIGQSPNASFLLSIHKTKKSVPGRIMFYARSNKRFEIERFYVKVF